MLMTLASLGCYNKEDDEINPAPAYSASSIEGYPTPGTNAVAPMVYPPPYFTGPYSGGYAANPDHSVGHIFLETLYSFCHGHDDDVMTAKEIESAFYSGAYSGLNDNPPSAVLNFEGPR
jgi:hypothetical protein